MKKKLFIISIFIILVGIFFRPSFAKALNIHIEQPIDAIKVGEKAVFKVYVDTENKEINVLEGNLKIKGEIEITSIDINNSIFNLWPNEPKIFNQEISFVGGIPGGVFGKNLRVFDVSIIPKSGENISFIADNIVAYLNNGIGTKVLAKPMNFEIKIGEQKVKKNNSLFFAIILLLFTFYFYRIFKNRKIKK